MSSIECLVSKWAITYFASWEAEGMTGILDVCSSSKSLVSPEDLQLMKHKWA